MKENSDFFAHFLYRRNFHDMTDKCEFPEILKIVNVTSVCKNDSRYDAKD